VGLHDLVKTKNVIFNGYGHIHQDYLKVNGEWKITRSHTSRLFVDEQCSSRCHRTVSDVKGARLMKAVVMHEYDALTF